MNVLIVGQVLENIIEAIQKSKRPCKIFSAGENLGGNIPNIEYFDFIDLAKKAKALKIDIIIVTDKNLVLDGIIEFLKSYHLNVVSVDKKWLNLEDKLIAKQLISYYSINYPEIIKTPLAFPITVKSAIGEGEIVVYSMAELIEAKEKFNYDKIFLEEYLEGQTYSMLSLWDKKNLFNFPIKTELNEVQRERLELYKTKLNFLLSDEKADFLGFFVTDLIWTKNDWYVLDYKMGIEADIDLTYHTKDFLYILELAIYQKLDEV